MGWKEGNRGTEGAERRETRQRRDWEEGNRGREGAGRRGRRAKEV